MKKVLFLMVVFLAPLAANAANEGEKKAPDVNCDEVIKGLGGKNLEPPKAKTDVEPKVDGSTDSTIGQ